MQQNASTQAWHVAKWGTWGWVETILKLIAVAAGLVAFVRSLSYEALAVANHPHLAAVIVLVLMTLAAVAQIAVRLGQHEIVSMAFAVLNLLGHLGLLFALLHIPDPRTLPLVFGVFWFAGQVTKLQFLRVSGYTEGGANTSAMLRTTAIIAALYALFVIFILI